MNSWRAWIGLLLMTVLAGIGNGQTRIDLRTQGRNADFSSQVTIPARTGTALPATCAAGEMFFKTDAAAGKNLYGCTAPNSWTPQAGGTASNYAAPLNAQSVLVIPGTTHKFQNVNLVVQCYDDSTPLQRVEPDSVAVDSTTYDVTVTFSTPQNGYCVVNGSGGIGGAASSAPVAQPNDLSVVRTSPTTLSIGSSCSVATPCNVRFGNTVYSLLSSATATIASGTGMAYIYVTPGGVLTVGHSGGVSCSAGCSVAESITAFPADSIPLSTWTATDGIWDSNGGKDWRAALSTKLLTGGTGIATLEASGQTVIGVDTATVPSFVTGAVTLDFPAMASGTCNEKSFSLRGVSLSDGIAAGWPGNLGAGLLGLMRVSAADTIAVRLCNFSGGSLGASGMFRATAVRSF